MSFCLYFSLLLLTCSHICSSQNDRLTRGTPLSVDQKLISSGGVFALGFFSPTNSTTNQYLGIWYNNIPMKTVVWVANRETPLTDPSGVLNITDDGNIALVDAKLTLTLWSSNVSNTHKNATAVLMDSGNFVLTNESGSVIWQSFDHPTDTLLPGMKLMYDSTTRTSQPLVAWKSPTDPSPGDVSVEMDPNFPLQVVLFKAEKIIWRYGIWNGKIANTAGLANVSSLYVGRIVLSDEGVYYTYTSAGDNTLMRFILDPIGFLNGSVWDGNAKKWLSGGYVPAGPCEIYNRCGKFGTCNVNGGDKVCECLRGFEPINQEEWNRGNYTSGCARNVSLDCNEEDTFLTVRGIRFPDKFVFSRNVNGSECEERCFKNCSCTAYAFINMTDRAAVDLRCFHWHEDLKDMMLDSNNGGVLFVRVANSAINTQVEEGSSKNKLVILTLVPISIALVLILSFCLWRRRQRIKDSWSRRKSSAKFDVLGEKDVIELPLLEFSTVSAATNNFSVENKLGEGGFGPVYKGKLRDGQEIAVKRLSKTSKQGFEEFKNEIQLIAKLQHTNLVRLISWCVYKDEKILIYEYLPNKSLDKFIFDQHNSAMLDWRIRYKIIEGIAQGLLYLHRYSRLRVIHRDLKTSNILLDGLMNPKIADFGLARIFGGDQVEGNTERVVGTYGYMSPEYASYGHFSEKSDVFSFGVIVLEIISGKRSTGYYPYKNSDNLVGYAWQLWEEGKGHELIDPSLQGNFSEIEAEKCLHVGLLSLQESATDRPAMPSVVSMLSSVNADLPRPSKPIHALGSTPNSSMDFPTSSASEVSFASHPVTA